MKKIALVLLIGLSLSFSALADRKLTYQCSNDEFTVTFTQVLYAARPQQKASLVIKNNIDDSEERHSLSIKNTGLSIRENSDSTVVTSERPNTMLVKLTIANIINPPESYRATLIINENGEDRTIEFSDCNVKNTLLTITRPLGNFEEGHIPVYR